MQLDKEDFYLDENGNTVFTAQFHLKRGYCIAHGTTKAKNKKIYRLTNYYKFTALV